MTMIARGLLLRVYRYLGIRDSEERKKLINEAMYYLENDREHFIELMDPESADASPDIDQGQICRMVPVAQLSTSEPHGDCTKESVVTLYLLVIDDDVMLALEHTLHTLHDNSSKDIHPFPVYQITNLPRVPRNMCVLPPQAIQPMATPAQKEQYVKIFMAYAKLARHLPLNYTPHNTERAMWHLENSPVVMVRVEEQVYTGSLVPLARSEISENGERPGFLRRCYAELLFMATKTESFYLIRYRSQLLPADKRMPVLPTLEDRMRYAKATLKEIDATLHPLYND